MSVKAFKTKIQLARELVVYAPGLGLEIQGVLFDSWYRSKEFVGFLTDNGLHWITRLKSDRNIKLNSCELGSITAQQYPQ